jgi:FKBP-type peptidyl-prolyl cis-trans isomerase
MKIALGLAAVLLAACAAPSSQSPEYSAAAPRAAAAPPQCEPAPRELVVKDLTPGTGKAVVTGNAVQVWYQGWVFDGCKPDLKGARFDGNVGGPVPLGVRIGAGRVIKGWDEGVVGMKEKGKRLLVIPPDKAYGARVFPDGRIPPNSTLVFEVDLHAIVPGT